MKRNLTELVFIIDRSGSMAGLESDTIGGFNAMLREQQSVEGEAKVTTVLFDDQYQVLHDRLDIRGIDPLTEQDYSARGSTALLDALGKTIMKIREIRKSTTEDHIAAKVLIFIITDGLENASHRYSAAQIKELIEHQQRKHGWEFIFMGANMDAIVEAGKLGIGKNRAHNFYADSEGIGIAYAAVSCMSTAYRDASNGKKSNQKMIIT